MLGQPPFGRWNYPEATPGSSYKRSQSDAPPASAVAEVSISRREIRVIDGLAVESSTHLPARRFDFGPVEGRGRVTLARPATEVMVVDAQYARRDEDLAMVADNRLFVFAPGETSVTDPAPRSFRYLAVAERDAEASVVAEDVRDQR